MFVSKSHMITMFLLTIFLTGCGAQLYKVAPLPAADTSPSHTGNDIAISAKIVDGDQSVEQFDTNLLTAGFIPIYIHIANRSNQQLSLGTMNFTLRDKHGKLLPQVSTNYVLAKMIKFNGLRFYTLEARKNTLNSYDAISLKQCSTMLPNTECRGILFFESKSKPPSLSGLIFQIRERGFEIKL